MRIAITGATGNVGTSVLAALADEPAIEEIVAIARRPAGCPTRACASTSPTSAATTCSRRCAAIDAVIHLAWLIQPSRDEAITRATNVDGSRRLLEAVAEAGVRTVVRLLGRRLLARPEGPPGRRVVADRRHPDLLLLTPQGRGRAAARPLRARPAAGARRGEAATGADLQARRRQRHPAGSSPGPLLPPALVPRADPARASTRRGCASRRSTRSTSATPTAASCSPTTPAAPSTSPPSRSSTGPSWRACSAHAGCRCAAACCDAADLTWRLRLQPSEPGWIDLALGVPLLDSDADPRTARLAADAHGRRSAAGAARRDPRTRRRTHAAARVEGELLRSTPLGSGRWNRAACRGRWSTPAAQVPLRSAHAIESISCSRRIEGGRAADRSPASAEPPGLACAKRVGRTRSAPAAGGPALRRR